MLRCSAFLFLILAAQVSAQSLYFPPISGGPWETVSPASLGWDESKIQPLFDYLQASNSKAFIVLKDGKIAIEHYFGTFTADSNWYWASAGKTGAGRSMRRHNMIRLPDRVASAFWTRMAV